jgi:hypothetical protein
VAGRLPIVLALVVPLVACGSTGEPSLDEVAGRYVATTFTVEQGGLTVDELGNGTELIIVLQVDGTTIGRLFVPGGAEGGGDLDASMTGTWVLHGATVTFAQSADTFVRDLSFTYDAGARTLSGTGTFGGATITVVLTRSTTLP